MIDGGKRPRRPPAPGLRHSRSGLEGVILPYGGEEDPGDAFLTLASGLDMSVTVEAVKTRDQFERLKSLGVNFAQGYLMGRPVPIDERERQPQIYRPCQHAAQAVNP